LKKLIPYLFKEMVFLASKTLLSSFGIGEINLIINLEHYDLTNGKE
jgi:hypothetical protein